MAEELIELGQGPVPPPVVATAMPAGLTGRPMSLSRQEAELLVRVIEAIVSFAQDFPLEFSSYCPSGRWQAVLELVGGGMNQIQSQLDAKQATVQVSADFVFAAMDLEECVTGARDARLSSAKIAMIISATAAVGQVFFGWGWLSVPAYIASLAVVLGRPLATRFKAEPAEPFRVGSARRAFPRREEAGAVRLLERVYVAPGALQHHHWGSVRASSSKLPAQVTLARGDFRVRIEGFQNDQIAPAAGWHRVSGPVPAARHEIDVYPAEWAGLAALSGNPAEYFVEYTGRRTGGTLRRAGPFQTKVDAMSHAIDDADITSFGTDGGVVITDGLGEIRKVLA